MNEIQRQHDRDGDVCREEAGCGEVEEDLKAVRQRQNAQQDQHKPSRVRLKWGLEGESVEETLVVQGLPESDVGEETDDPRNIARDGRDIDEPVEYSGTRVGKRQICKQTRSPRCKDCDPWNSVSVRPGKDLRSLFCERQSVQHTRPGEQERVASRPCGSQDRSIDDVIQSTNSSLLNADDKRAGACVGLWRQQSIVVRRHGDSNDERSHAIEDEQSPHVSSGGFWDVASRGDGFTCGQCNQLRRGDECKASPHESRPVCQKAPRWTGHEIVFERILFPVPKSKSIVIRTSSEEQNPAENDQSGDGDEFDGRKPELCLTEKRDCNDVEEEYQSKEYGDPCCGINS